MKMHSYEHQDWEPVVFNKKEGGSKNITYQNSAGTKRKNELLSDDIPSLKVISKEQSLAIIQARNAKGISQKELAQKMGVNVSIIQEYENGKVKSFNKSFLTRIMKVLGAKL